MNGIIELQNKYLDGGGADEAVLAAFYVEVLKLSKFIIGLRPEYPMEDAYTLAADLATRLMQRKTKVISSAPAQYIKNALYFMHKPTKVRSFEDYIKYCVEDKDDEYGAYIRELMSNIYIPDSIKPYVEVCLEDKVPIKDMRKSIEDKTDLKRFNLVMEQVRKYAVEKTM